MDYMRVDPDQRRIAYLKNGDVAAEVAALGPVVDEEILDNGGPYHYIGSFLKFFAGSRMLLISTDVSNKRFTRDGLVAKVINTKQFRSPFGQAALHLTAFFRIFFELIRFRPDWILCAAGGGAALAACRLASKFLKIPYVHSRHMRVALYRPSTFQKIKLMIDVRLIRGAAYVMCNGPYLHDQLVGIAIPPRRIIEFRVPYRRYREHQRSAEKDDAENGCDICYVGRIEKKKGAWDLLRACRPILLEKDSVRLTYIGDGMLLDALKREALETGVSEKVSFSGRLPHSAVVDTLRSCDILVVPTRQELGEGRPKAVIEGLIMGCCLLVPDYGAFRYLVKNGVNGMMYRPEDIADMTQKIRYLVENSNIRKALGRDAAMLSYELRQPSKTFYQALENITRLLP